MKISDLEKRNAWLSIYSTSLAGVIGDEELDEDEIDEMSQTAAELADAGLNLFEETFTGGRERDDDEPETETRRKRSRRTG